MLSLITRFFNWLGLKGTLILAGFIILLTFLLTKRVTISTKPIDLVGDSVNSEVTFHVTRQCKVEENVNLVSIFTELAGDINNYAAFAGTISDMMDGADSVSEKKQTIVVPKEAAFVGIDGLWVYGLKDESVSLLHWLLELGHPKQSTTAYHFLCGMGNSYVYANCDSWLGFNTEFEGGQFR